MSIKISVRIVKNEVGSRPKSWYLSARGGWFWPGCAKKAQPGQNFGRGKLRAEPESRAQSARVLRANPEPRARSARELRAKSEPRAQPEINRGEGSGEGARWAPPQKFFLKFKLETVQSGVHLKQKSIFYCFWVWRFQIFPHFLKAWSLLIYLQTCLKNSGVCRIYSWVQARSQDFVTGGT